MSGPDQSGIVAALAQLLYGHGANILDADQHTDREAGVVAREGRRGPGKGRDQRR